MHRIDNATSAGILPTPQPVGPNPNGFFQPQTIVPADWLNAVQQEISAVIESAGITLDKTASNQLLAAIVKKLLNASAWRNYEHVPGYFSANTIQFLSVDHTAIYKTGLRIKIVGPLTGTLYGSITSSIFILNNTRVSIILDAGSIQNETLTSVHIANFYILDGGGLPYGLHALDQGVGSDLFLKWDPVTRKINPAIINLPSHLTDDARQQSTTAVFTTTGNNAIHQSHGWFEIANSNPAVNYNIVLKNLHASRVLRYSYSINGGTRISGTLAGSASITLSLAANDYYDMLLTQFILSGQGQVASIQAQFDTNAYHYMMCHYSQNTL